jgi:hypothetical protein
MKKLILTIVAFLGLFVDAMAQTATHGVDITINSVAMIRAVDVYGGTPNPAGFIVGQGMFSSITPGEKPTTDKAPNSSELYLQYTSIKTATGTPRTIKAALTTGTIPAGLSISALAGTPTGTGAVGITNDQQTISATAATMIKNIGSGYTGADAGNGVSITYTAVITAVASLVATPSTTLTVTYTLSNE